MTTTSQFDMKKVTTPLLLHMLGKELEVENNRSGLVRWNKMEVVKRTNRRFEIKITRCMFHEFAAHLSIPEMTPIDCQIDNAMFNSCLPDEMTFDRGGIAHRLPDRGWQARMQFRLGIAAGGLTRLSKRAMPHQSALCCPVLNVRSLDSGRDGCFAGVS